MLLEAKELEVGYPSRTVFRKVNLNLNAGCLALVIGANGSGKSSLLRTLAGSQPALGGTIEIDGIKLGKMTSGQLAKKLAIVLTDRTGGGGLRVEELVAIGRNPYSGFFGKLSDADHLAINNALKAVGLINKAQQYVTQLSDGERQKAMIARAIAQETKIIILDEPTSFLDVSSRFEILSLLSSLAHEDKKAILMSTHDTSAALPLADTIWAVENDSIKTGDLDTLFHTGILDTIFPGIVYDSDSTDFRPKSMLRKESAQKGHQN